MANIQGRPSRSLQGMVGSLQGWSLGGLLYVANTNENVIRVFSVDGTYLTDISTIISGVAFEPKGVSVYNDLIYICSETSTLGSVDLIHAFSKSGVHQFSFCPRQISAIPTGGEAAFPISIHGYKGNVYISDSSSFMGTPFCFVSKFDESGNYVSRFGAYGSSDGQFGSISSVYCYNDEIYVSDTGNSVFDSRIQVFDMDGNYLRKWGQSGTSDGEFDVALNVFALGGLVYVCDGSSSSSTNRIQIFDTQGTFIDSFGGSGTGDGEFDNPTQIVRSLGRIYVSDGGNDRIQVFDSSNTHLYNISTNIDRPSRLDIG